ncbi:hypothetical protein EVAR_417_1 [Eumeta japonica]|uniref:Peptidase A2 domain-containing protein n=1 Tax=Eumeta variegata TaxID=151549 RepID=A0A4C1SA30_EUMVA|nr:hypothetical protein EVAR_417_1 [Eumeta japonica]
MRVLERRFERPDAIIKQELNKLRRMMPMNGGMGNISSFANKKGGSRNLRAYTGTTPAKNKHDQHYERKDYVEADIIGYSTKRPREGHEERPDDSRRHRHVSVNNVNTMRAYLKIVPVELYGPEGSMKVHALLDEGSTVTLIDEQVANRIGAKGRRETLRVSSVGGNEITDEKSRPAASLTQLGWVLHGCCSSLSRPINTVHHLRPSDASDIELNDIVKRHFEIESLGVAPRKPSHDPEEGAQPAPNQSTSERLWYLPHFAVTHPQKKKVRLVFDAAARTNGKCLNDALLTGPDLIRSLLGVLVRFRQGRVCQPTSKCSCGSKSERRSETARFLWRNNMHENPQEYRMTSLIFGAASSLWDINNDALGFNLGLRNTPTEVLETSLPPTKRQVTSAVMSVFDPLGLASPVLITGKCMLRTYGDQGSTGTKQ